MNLPATTLTDIKLGDLIVCIESITNVDQLFEELLSKNPEHEDVKDERIPYWADLWPSAVALSEYLLRSKIVQPGTKVLELGCGLGLPGIVAGKVGAQVVFSDYLQGALDLAERNWKRNNNGIAEFVLMDWRNPLPGLNAELIIASDIAYEKKSFNDLVSAFKTLLTPEGRMLIAEPNRAFAQSFFAELNQHGFEVHSTLEKLNFRGQKYSVHLHMLKQKY
ncbi:MAG: methyltransferase domain-containing protein [Bacteroidia bacterium]|nr:methyltransferase domain-containing protein [Bacteroidia bacterium]